MRTLTCIAALGAALLMTHSAFAASAVVNACRADIKSQCGDEMKSAAGGLSHSAVILIPANANRNLAIDNALSAGLALKSQANQFGSLTTLAAPDLYGRVQA